MEDENSSLFSLRETTEIRKIVIDLVQRLDKQQQQHSKDDNVMDSASVNNSKADMPECDAVQPPMPASSATSRSSVEEVMALAIIMSSACKPARTTNKSQELMKVIRQEMKLYENGGIRDWNLQFDI